MPTVSRIKGYRFFFFSEEGREPPHIHVESGDYYAKFWLGPVCLARSKGFRSHEINEIQKLVEKNLTLFHNSWHEYFGSKS